MPYPQSDDDDLPPLDDIDDLDRERAADMLDNRPQYGNHQGTTNTPLTNGEPS